MYKNLAFRNNTHLHTHIYPLLYNNWCLGFIKNTMIANAFDYSFAAWNNQLPFRKGALRGTSLSVISTCSCWCCLTRFPSLPARKIFSPSLIFRDWLLKSSFLDKGDLGAVLADTGRAKREGLDILPVQECTCSKSNSLKKILRSSLSSTEAGEFVCAAQLDVECCAASLISFKHRALGGHAVPQTCGMQMCAGVRQMTLSRCWVPTTLWGAEALPGTVWSSWCALRSSLAWGECSTYAGTAWKTTQAGLPLNVGPSRIPLPTPLSQTNTFLFQQISSQCAKTTLLQC